MALNLAKTVFNFLKDRPNEKHTARDIANWIFLTYPEECKEKKERSNAKVIPLLSDEALIQQLVAEISSQRARLQSSHVEIKTTDGRPRKYYFSNLSDEAEIDYNIKLSSNIQTTAEAFPELNSEQNLYPILSKFLWEELNIYSKRINEKKSRNSRGPRGNHWLYPDLVGLEDLSLDWDFEVKNTVDEMASQKARLWSFEVKKMINNSNVRESFFQAVSNSSWANFGYLVVGEIQGAESEMRILSGLHGIGLIKLDIANPLESEIMIPAREKSNVDWNTANRIAKENTDFLDYIKLIRQFYQTGEHRPRDWDISQD